MNPIPKLIRLVLSLAASAASLSAQEASRIADVLKPVLEKHQLAGAVALVADKDKVLALDAAGFADIAAKKPMTTDAMFWIASMSKPITAAAFMMLVDEGKVSVDDPVEKYLPEFKGQMVIAEKDENHVLLKKPVHPILVRNVLGHTSGLDFKNPLENPTLDGLPLALAVRGHAMTPLLFQPDSAYKYSNAGINTAARIIEVVSGMSYEDFMQRRLFDPLGMKDTTFWPDAAQGKRIAKAYKANAAKDGIEETPVGQLKYPLTDRTGRFPMPAGGLFSTAEDVAIFCQMLLNGGVHHGKRLISEAGVKQMTSRQTAPELKESYGFGFAVNGDNFGHGGAYATNMNIDRAHGLVTVWMVQNSGFPKEWPNAQGLFKQWAEKRFAK
jgi:CubicO group peptidase (beta-lactamase class C family)